MRVIAPLVLSFSISSIGYAGQAAQPVRSSAASSAASRVDQGRRFLQAGDLERARASLDAAIAQDPSLAEAHYLLGLLAERRQDLPAAAASFA